MTDEEILDVFATTKAENQSGYMLAVARAIIERERERCAAVCDRLSVALDHAGNEYQREASASQCAKAIRRA